MYVPKDFAEQDPERLGALMREHDFATLVTVADSRPFATHLPLMFDPARGAQGTLIGHMARANPQWRAFDGVAEALAIFSGPDGYVSPRWYAAHPSVPTWNYAAVHAYGAPRILEDPEAARAAVAELVTIYEGSGEGAWTMDGLPADYTARMLRATVAFEMPVARLEGKFKLSQNRSAEDRRRVIDALASRSVSGDRALADLMRAREPADAAE